jgi:cytochrome c55X
MGLLLFSSPLRRLGLGTVWALLATSTLAQTPSATIVSPTAERQQALVRMVRQDCGSCHGLYLTGGLGPALTPEALADKPLDSMVATIYGGRPGTPMAPWKAMLSEAEARWITEQLFAGFPASPPKAPQ